MENFTEIFDSVDTDNVIEFVNATVDYFKPNLFEGLLDFANSTVDNFNAASDNSTLEPPFEWESFLVEIRELYIEQVYGEHYKLNFFVTLAVSILGYITNIFNVAVLSTTPMAHSMNVFLLVLSALDMLLITTQCSHIVHYLSGFKMFPNYEWVLFFIINTYVETILLFAVNWLMVAIGVWRFLAVTWPLQSREWCSKGRAQKVVALIIVLSAILATPVFAVLTYKVVPYMSRDLYDKTFSDLATRNDGIFLKFYWALLLFESFIPSILLGVLTFGLFRTLYRARRMRSSITGSKRTTAIVGSHRTTVMLTILLVLYVLSNFPDGCMVLLSLVTNGNSDAQTEYRHATDIIRLFMLTTNASSFFIYYGLGEGFRTRFHRLFCCCFMKRTTTRDSGKTTISDLTRSRTSMTSVYSQESVNFKPKPFTVL